MEHILPESLGGKNWACLAPGLLCSSCNQYFGAKVESRALAGFPFLPFRLLLGIPSKHRRPPTLKTHIGTLRASLIVGTIGLDPTSSAVEEGVVAGRITQVRILAEPEDPLAVCRLLLKMGVETVASQSAADACSPRFAAARSFARHPKPGDQWWFLICCDHGRLFERFKRGVSASQWAEGVSLSTVEEQGAEMFHLRLLELSLITPLEPMVLPDSSLERNEPDWRLFWVKA